MQLSLIVVGELFFCLRAFQKVKKNNKGYVFAYSTENQSLDCIFDPLLLEGNK